MTARIGGLPPMKASEFFTLPESLARFAPHFRPDAAPWEWLKQIGAALAAPADTPPARTYPPGVHVEGAVWLHPTVKLPAFATLIGPLWIGANTEIRPGAFLRGNVIVGGGSLKLRRADPTKAWETDFGSEPLVDLHGAWVDPSGALWGAGGQFAAAARPNVKRQGTVARYAADVVSNVIAAP